MAIGRPFSGSTDSLFTGFFLAATILNFVPVIIAEPVQAEVAVVGTAHLLVIVRILIGTRVAARQRLADLERFQQLKKSS